MEMKMKIRAHRALLADAMKTVKEIEPTRNAVYDYFLFQIPDVEMQLDWLGKYNRGDIEVKPYHYDSRIGWDTHIVTLKGNAIGFTDSPLKE